MENTDVFKDNHLKLSLVFPLSVVAGLSSIISQESGDIRLRLSFIGNIWLIPLSSVWVPGPAEPDCKGPLLCLPANIVDIVAPQVEQRRVPVQILNIISIFVHIEAALDNFTKWSLGFMG